MTTQATYISAADTAKEIRRALKAVFPSVKFSVRTDTYAGGASVRVAWTDGPIEKRVEAITKNFEGVSFNSSDDSRSYLHTEYQGRDVHFGANYVFTNRRHSLDLLNVAIAMVNAQYGITEEPVIVTPAGYEPYVDPRQPLAYSHPGGSGYTYLDMIHQTVATLEG